MMTLLHCKYSCVCVQPLRYERTAIPDIFRGCGAENENACFIFTGRKAKPMTDSRPLPGKRKDAAARSKQLIAARKGPTARPRLAQLSVKPGQERPRPADTLSKPTPRAASSQHPEPEVQPGNSLAGDTLRAPARTANGDAQGSMALVAGDAAEDGMLSTYSALGSAESSENIARVDRLFTTPAPALALAGTESTGPQGTTSTTYSHAAAAASLRERQELREIEAMKVETAKIQRENLIMQLQLRDSGSADQSGRVKALGRSRQACTPLPMLLHVGLA